MLFNKKLKKSNKKPEHSPSPDQARGIYGFVFMLLCSTFMLMYILWIIIPSETINSWTYQPPQKYWAAAVPILLCTTLFIFAFFIYPSLHQIHDGELDDLSSITDNYALPTNKSTIFVLGHCQRKNKSQIMHTGRCRDLSPIPTASDIDIDDVCQTLYS